jgi:hypothetical protein
MLMLNSKGAAAVTGGGFITLAATLASVGSIPVAGITLLLGIDRFMSEMRSLVNLVGNATATIVVARWEKQFDEGLAKLVLDGDSSVNQSCPHRSPSVKKQLWSPRRPHPSDTNQGCGETSIELLFFHLVESILVEGSTQEFLSKSSLYCG